MKHINLTNWTGTITHWVKLNYLNGLPDYYADIANIDGNYIQYNNGNLEITDNSVSPAQTIVIPTGYTWLNYIELERNGYIDLNITTTADVETIIKTDAQFTNITASVNQLMGADYGTYFGINSNNKFVAGSTTQGVVADADASKHEFTLTLTVPSSSMVFKVDDTTYNVDRGSVTRAGINVYIGSILQDGTYDCYVVIYTFQIYVDGELVRNCIPAKRNSDEAIGVYDTISSTFYAINY